ncbi:MAG: adenosylcobalamin-dependent ribonucleoside-diphosphate reductase [Bacteroidota bacterium]|nr:adenosylcobalamin-dependent ribonucleoside-diphosphate reductase [Bacteroidota bacterium]
MNPFSENALKVLDSRYLRRNLKGKLTETPDELLMRVAKAVAAAELEWGTNSDAQKWQVIFYESMKNLLFLPNSPALMNAGTSLNQLSACFVLPIEDNLDSIFTTLKNAALIQQSGGGTGFNFSHLRPAHDLISITGGEASGPVSFMKVFNAATEHVKHGGKRRGANMGILNVDHPDIEEFVLSKKDEKALNNFNISVGITDKFMEAVEKDDTWKLVHPNSKSIAKTIKAKDLWKLIIENAWAGGDPGLVFLDTINAGNPLLSLGKIECTNPCGEVPLLPYESCNLGSINLSNFVEPDKGKNSINFTKLGSTIEMAIRFLDNVIEVNHYLLGETKSIVSANRKIGLGVMGWADLLIKLEIPYDSEEAISLAGRVMNFFKEKSLAASVKLAKQRGVFKNWEKSIFYPDTRLRNATRLSIAPTGTISIIANTSSSIEPLFAIAYQRSHVLDGSTLSEVNPLFIDHLKRNKLYSESLMDEVSESGYLQHIRQIPIATRNLFKTALEISPAWHLKHQVAFQQYVDNAVSKTINLAETASFNDIEDIYFNAWRQKTKGITIFRYNSKHAQVLEKGISKSEKAWKVCID